MELIFVFAGIKPFSADRILISDLYYEYIPFYNYFRDAILSGRSILSSFSFTMGQNVIGILAYYCLSPLNILLLFSNSYNIAYFIKALIIIKILLCSLTMSIYLKGKTSDLKVVMFSLIYALTSYNILYAFNVMWLDVVYLLPLVILGLENFINGKGKNLYLISLSIMIFSNFYIAFGSCIFALFYFFYYSFIKEKLTLKLFSKFLGLSLIAGLLNAFMLLPTFYNMLGGKFDNAGTYANFILYDPKAIIYNFIPGVKVGSFLIDLPYFYVSSLVLVLFSLFIFSSSVKIKEKATTFIFILLLVFFTLIAPLDLMMHCFRVPNCFNYRYIFNLSFLFISVVAKKEFKFNYFTIIPLVLIIAWACTLDINYQVIIFAFLLITYWILSKFNKPKIIFLILILELVYSGATVRQLKPSDLNYDKVNSYKELLKEYMPSENEFYRIELSEPITVNDSFILGTYGISSFSPTLSSVSNTFLKDYLKMPEKDSYNLVYKNRTIFDSYILGIKYEIKDDQVVENKNYLPLVFKIDNLDYFEPSDSVLENTNKIYYMINGEYILKEVEFDLK